jgi:hypothetical protein
MQELILFWEAIKVMSPQWEMIPAVVLFPTAIYLFIEVSSLIGWPEGWREVPSMVEDWKKSVRDAWRAVGYFVGAMLFAIVFALILSVSAHTFWWELIYILLYAVVFLLVFVSSIGAAIGFVFIITGTWRISWVKKIALIIDNDAAWLAEFHLAANAAGYQTKQCLWYEDHSEAVVCIVGAEENGNVVGPEYVSRLRLSHPEACIVVASTNLTSVPSGTSATVGEFCTRAGADHLIDKSRTYDRAALVQLLKQ